MTCCFQYGFETSVVINDGDIFPDEANLISETGLSSMALNAVSSIWLDQKPIL